MRPAETAAALAAFPDRRAGTDAERRAACWLANEIRASGRTAAIHTFWCRPDWALAQAWHCVPAVVGSVLAVHQPRLGGALVLAALACVLADALTGVSPGRLLTGERASQNVVSSPAPVETGRLRLVVTAAYDAPRAGLVRRAAARPLPERLRRVAGFAPGWAGWLTLELVWLVAIAIARNGGSTGTAIGVLQLIPTAALVIEAALLLSQATAATDPQTGTSGAAVALALIRALDAAPPRRLVPELVLHGAGTIGLRRHLRRHGPTYTARTAIVLGIADGGAGRPAFRVSGAPLRFHPRLRRLAQQAGAAPHRGRGISPALPARARGLPALTLGCISDRPGAAPDTRAMDALLQTALTLVDALDAELVRTVSGTAGAAPAAA